MAERAEVPVCEQTGWRSVNGACPRHKGDACLVWTCSHPPEFHDDAIAHLGDDAR